MTNCTICGDMGAVEWPESPFPCPDCRPAEYLAALVDCGWAKCGMLRKQAERAARKVLDGEGRRENQPCVAAESLELMAETLFRKLGTMTGNADWQDLRPRLHQTWVHLIKTVLETGGVTLTEGSPVDSRDEAMSRAATARREARQYLLAGALLAGETGDNEGGEPS